MSSASNFDLGSYELCFVQRLFTVWFVVSFTSVKILGRTSWHLSLIRLQSEEKVRPGDRDRCILMGNQRDSTNLVPGKGREHVNSNENLVLPYHSDQQFYKFTKVWSTNFLLPETRLVKTFDRDKDDSGGG